MFNRNFTLELRPVDGIIRWTLLSRRGRVVSVGIGNSRTLAYITAHKHLPRRGKIKKIRILYD